MAVGDGGGVLPVPSPDQTALINEQYRAPLNRLVIADQAANVIRAEMIMPPQAGGFWIREAAFFDETGICLAVANLPESYKPLLAEGSGRFQVINIWLMVSQTADVQMIADPSVILATVEEVRRAGNNAKDYADDIVSTLRMRRGRPSPQRSAPLSVPGSWITRRHGEVCQNVNPNERWPWSMGYTGENKTIRVAKLTARTSARPAAAIPSPQRANLPAVQIDVSGETSEQPEQKLTTTRGGIHNHGGVAGK
jgi:phage-related tail fiber protein